MKYRDTFLAVVSAAAIGVGCKPTDSQTSTNQTSAPPADIEQVRRETREALKAANNYAYAQRQEFAAKMKTELEGLKQEMDELAANIKKSNAATKDEAAPKLRSLQEKSDKLNERMEEVKSATESTWDEIKTGARKGADELKESIKQARQWLSEKLAPSP
jgi:hypothetical protein